MDKEVQEAIKTLLQQWDIQTRWQVLQEHIESKKVKALHEADPMAQFWKGLHELATKDDSSRCLSEPGKVLQLEKGHGWPDLLANQTLEVLFVRASYNNILHYALQHCKTLIVADESSSPSSTYWIKGTAGIGKSMMVVYVLWVLLRCMKEKTMIVLKTRPAKHHAVIRYAFVGKQVYKFGSDEAYEEFVAWCPWNFLDGNAESVWTSMSHCLMHFSTVNDETQAMYRKIDGFREIVMFPWDLDELKTLARHHPLFKGDKNIEEVEQKFHRYGGKARSFFLWTKTEKELEKDLNDGVKKLLIDAETTVAYIDGSQFNKCVDRVLYRVMDTSALGPETSGDTFWHEGMDTDTKLVLGSDHIKDKFTKALLERHQTFRRDFLNALLAVPKGVSMAGFVFEAYVHCYFEDKASVGEVILHGCKGDSKKYKIEYSKCAKFDDKLKEVEQGVYYETASQNFPAIDSFIWSKGHLTGFQITSQKKGTKEVDLTALNQTALGETFCRLVMDGGKNDLQQAQKHDPGKLAWTIYIIVLQDAQLTSSVTRPSGKSKVKQHMVYIKDLF